MRIKFPASSTLARLARIVVCITLWLPGGRVLAGDIDPAARDHLDRGLVLYAEKHYEAASKAFSEGYALDPRPEFLFAWAQAERLAGHPQRAIELYREFLTTEPPTQQVEASVRHIIGCEHEIANASKPEEVKPPPAPTPPPPPRLEPLSVSLVAVGSALAAVGGGLLGGAELRYRKLENIGTYNEFSQQFPTHTAAAQRLRLGGSVVLAVGGSTLIIGTILWARHAVKRRRAREQHRLSAVLAPTRFGGAVGIGGRF